MKGYLFECIVILALTYGFSHFLANYRRKDNIHADLDLSEISRDYSDVIKTSWKDYSILVEQISNMEPSINRNLWISKIYQEIGYKFAKLIGTQGEHYANVWTYMGAWASNSVGDSIRMCSNSGPLDYHSKLWLPLIKYILPEELFGHVKNYIDDSIRNCFSGLSQGNVLIFKEVAAAFAKFGEHFENTSVKSEELWGSFKESLIFDSCDNLNYTILDSMDKYYRAMFEADTKIKHELVFWGNMLVGYVEQFRLQQALEIAFPDTFTLLNKPFIGEVTIAPATWMTKWYISIQFPRLSLKTGYDTPVIAWSKNYWPLHLQNFTLAGLKQLYNTFSANPHSVIDSRAENWLHFSQRMRYVFVLMRAYQDDESLQCPLFNKDQEKLIRAGKYPEHADMCHLDFTCCEDYIRK